VYKLVFIEDDRTGLPVATVHCLGIGDGVHRGLLDGVASRWVGDVRSRIGLGRKQGMGSFHCSVTLALAQLIACRTGGVAQYVTDNESIACKVWKNATWLRLAWQQMQQLGRSAEDVCLIVAAGLVSVC
jgi:hypothetical protein